mmetsp:Transcript_4696/g.8243  ORF Transcript_4696/g.8243 Transcript_4696/m.8243 type:complete len:121 (-) Transcript_4696:188-550(-)
MHAYCFESAFGLLRPPSDDAGLLVVVGGLAKCVEGILRGDWAASRLKTGEWLSPHFPFAGRCVLPLAALPSAAFFALASAAGEPGLLILGRLSSGSSNADEVRPQAHPFGSMGGLKIGRR